MQLHPITAVANEDRWRALPVLARVIGIAALGMFALLAVGADLAHASLGNVQLRGQANLTFRGDSDGIGLNEYNAGDGAYDLLRLRLFLEAAPSDRLQILTQIHFNDNLPSSIRLYGAYVLYEAVRGGSLYFEAGKIPSAFGTYAARSYPDKTVLIGTPLMYYYHSGLRNNSLPADAKDLLALRTSDGQKRFKTYPSGSDSGNDRFGMPILYDPCWDLGAVALGARGTLEYRIGLTAGTPGSPVSGDDRNENKTLVGRLGWAPRAWVRMGASGATGAYLSQSLESSLPSGDVIDDFRQDLVGLDLELSHGRWVFHSEAVWNRWDSPNISGGLDQNSVYAEMEVSLLPGLRAAARYDELIYGKIDDGDGNLVRWDQSIRRVELGTSYWISRALMLKLNYQMNSFGVSGFDPHANLSALQITARF